MSEQELTVDRNAAASVTDFYTYFELLFQEDMDAIKLAFPDSNFNAFYAVRSGLLGNSKIELKDLLIKSQWSSYFEHEQFSFLTAVKMELDPIMIYNQNLVKATRLHDPAKFKTFAEATVGSIQFWGRDRAFIFREKLKSLRCD